MAGAVGGCEDLWVIVKGLLSGYDISHSRFVEGVWGNGSEVAMQFGIFWSENQRKLNTVLCATTFKPLNELRAAVDSL